MAEDMAGLLREVEAIVVKAWLEQEERANTHQGLRRGMLVALSAHVLRFGAALRSLHKSRRAAATSRRGASTGRGRADPSRSGGVRALHPSVELPLQRPAA